MALTIASAVSSNFLGLPALFAFLIHYTNHTCASGFTDVSKTNKITTHEENIFNFPRSREKQPGS